MNFQSGIVAVNAVLYFTGKQLWRDATAKAIGGGVISYQAGGKQRIAVATGMNTSTWNLTSGPGRVVVYALP